jgi:hypothetical protein
MIKKEIKNKFKFFYDGNYIHCILSRENIKPIVYKIYLLCHIINKFNTIKWHNLPNSNLNFFTSHKIINLSSNKRNKLMINKRNKLIILAIKIKSNYKFKFPYEGNYIHCILSSKYNIPIIYKIYLSSNIKNKSNTIT